MIDSFLEDEIELSVSSNNLVSTRSGWKRKVLDVQGKSTLSRVISGQIPYFYRDPDNIADDFREKHDALLLIADMFRTAPTTDKFRCSHFGEILASIYIEQILGYKILMRKLTQTTAENTNVHKMDVMCVNTKVYPYEYLWFEAKSSIQHGNKTYHRHGIYKQMIESLEKYKDNDLRFDIVKICDNLSHADFLEEERLQIKKDLKRPVKIIHNGFAVINFSTISSADEDYILTEKCARDFNVRILAVSDLKNLAVSAYSRLEKMKNMSEEDII